MQFGFEFYTDAPRGVGIEQPAGTWLMSCETAASYGAKLATARERVQGVAGVFRVLFERGLAHADRYLTDHVVGNSIKGIHIFGILLSARRLTQVQ